LLSQQYYFLTPNNHHEATPGFRQMGPMYAYFNLWDGLHLFDFDRETGFLSNGVDLDFGCETNGDVWQSSVEFSHQRVMIVR